MEDEINLFNLGGKGEDREGEGAEGELGSRI